MLFSPTGFSVASDLQKLATGTPFTHVGVAYRPSSGSQPMIWECTREEGCVLSSLARRVRSGKYRCVVRHINLPVDAGKLAAIIRSGMGAPYTHGHWRAVVMNACPARFPVPTRDKSMRIPRFCSDMAAETYAKLGVFDFSGDDQRPPAAILPGDFAQETHDIPVAAPYGFGPERMLRERSQGTCS